MGVAAGDAAGRERVGGIGVVLGVACQDVGVVAGMELV